METNNNKQMETKVCSKCGRELPLSEYYPNRRTKDGFRYTCKECYKESNREAYARRMAGNTNPRYKQCPNPDTYFDERMKGITPRELIEELRQRGFTGHLEYKEIKVHKINI